MSGLDQESPDTTVENLITWMNNSSHGDRITYYIGDLGSDRDVIKHSSLAVSRKINDIANAAMKMSKSGEAYLFQRRVDESKWRYIAVRRKIASRNGNQ